MKKEFITTENTNRFNDICREMEDPGSLIGPSMAMATAPTGRGKSEACRHYATHSSAIYIPPMNVRSPLMLLQEIVFELSKTKPGRVALCLDVLEDEMGRERRMIVIDEADLLSIKLLEMLRNINERYACPILLVGEDELKGKVSSRRRIASRIRRRMEFAPITQPDIALFLQKSLGHSISSKSAAVIRRHCRGDWRPVLTLAAAIERIMKASDFTEITDHLVKGIIHEIA